MKSTGIVRRIDELGRFVLPIEIRENLDIGPKDPLEIYVEGSRIILKKFQPCCIFLWHNKHIKSQGCQTKTRDSGLCTREGHQASPECT